MKMIKDVMEYTMTDEEYIRKHKCQCRQNECVECHNVCIINTNV